MSISDKVTLADLFERLARQLCWASQTGSERNTSKILDISNKLSKLLVLAGYDYGNQFIARVEEICRMTDHTVYHRSYLLAEAYVDVWCEVRKTTPDVIDHGLSKQTVLEMIKRRGTAYAIGSMLATMDYLTNKSANGFFEVLRRAWHEDSCEARRRLDIVGRNLTAMGIIMDTETALRQQSQPVVDEIISNIVNNSPEWAVREWFDFPQQIMSLPTNHPSLME